MTSEYRTHLERAKAAEQSGKFADAEGYLNDALAAAIRLGDVDGCHFCYVVLTGFLIRRGRMDEAKNTKKLADMLGKSP